MAIISSLEKNQIANIVKKIYEGYEEKGEKVPEWVKVMAHRPEILKEFFELLKVVMGKGEVVSKLKWKIAYAVSEANKCPFCVDVTTAMLKKLGATDKEIDEVKNLKNLTEKEKEILTLVKEITEKANICTPELFEKMKKDFREPEIVEIVSIICLFNYINRFNNTFCILPE